MLRVTTIENGIVRGLPAADPRITSFKGIPFAAPPVGENRWRAPQPANDWTGIYEAFEFAPISLQAPLVNDQDNIYNREWNVDPNLPMNEDCLYLNIWTPAKNINEKLPVFIWFFGGAFVVGNTAEMEFDGERIARRGIVVVTVNYRLNAFGFLCHPDITKEAPEAPGNFGLLDQQMAIRWTRRNIAAFGGDPEKITIGGQSAGGMSVSCQLANLQNNGLFQRAIIQSGLFSKIYPEDSAPQTFTISEAEQTGISFLEFLGVSTLKEARNLDQWYIRDKTLQFNGNWGPVIDCQFLPDNPFKLLETNQCLQTPILLGNTSAEFVSTPRVKTIDEFRDMAFKCFSNYADEYLNLCGDLTDNLENICNRVSASGLELAARLTAQNIQSKVSKYYYIFEAEIPGWDNPGTFHSVDLWFFFETLAKCWRPFSGKHYDLARKMCNYWCNFIISGDPNGEDADGTKLPEWTPYTLKKPFAMRFGNQVFLDSKGPNSLMSFLLQYKKEHPI